MNNVSYKYDSTSYSIRFLKEEYKNNRINFNLSCQRGDVWSEEQQQSMIDTLMWSERIPEIHCIMEGDGDILGIIDGKQRLTTIIDFVLDIIPWKRRYADQNFSKLFNESRQLYFSKLPAKIQNKILNTTINFAIYSDITPKGENRLFKKLNQGTSLNAFQKAIINNISVRTQFSEKLLGHPGLEKLYSNGCFERDVVENHLISLLGFMLACDNNKSLNAISLEPKDLLKENNTSYILNVDNLSDDDAEKWIKELNCKANQIEKMLDIFADYPEKIKSIQNKGHFVFPFIYKYYYDLSDENFLDLFFDLRKVKNTDVTSSANFTRANVERWINYIDNNILFND